MIGLFLVGCVTSGALDLDVVDELGDTADQVPELDTGETLEGDTGEGLEDTAGQLEATASEVLGVVVECGATSTAVAWELDATPTGVVQVELWPTLAGAGLEVGDPTACGAVVFPGVDCEAGPFVAVVRAPGAPCVEVGGRYVSSCEHRALMPEPVCQP